MWLVGEVPQFSSFKVLFVPFFKGWVSDFLSFQFEYFLLFFIFWRGGGFRVLQTDRHTEGHGDSITESADSVKKQKKIAKRFEAYNNNSKSN